MAKRPAQPAAETRFDRRHTDHQLHDHFQHLEQHARRVDGLLADVVMRLCSLEEQGKVLVMGNDKQLAILGRIDKATTSIAAALRRLKDKTDDPEVNAGLETAASRLEAMANDPENPDPEAPPEEVPADPTAGRQVR